MEIRKCSIKDAELIRKLSIETYRQTFDEFNTEENMKAYLNGAYNLPKLKQELEALGEEFFVVFEDETAAGYMKINEVPFQSDFNDDSESLELERLYALKEFHGKGVGKMLMDKVIEIARQRNKKYIWLGVWEHNERAKRFYDKYGYYKIGSHDFVMGDDVQTDFIMRKDI